MKALMSTLILGLVFVCSENVLPSKYKSKNYNLDQIYRCENEEVVCYTFIGYKKGGHSCFAKNQGMEEKQGKNVRAAAE